MARPWSRSTWVRVGGAVLVLGLVGVLAAPFLIPVDHFRPALVRLLETITGHDVRIDGLKLHLVPTVHIQATNVRMRNPHGFPPGDALMVKSVDLGVAPRALLSRRLIMTYIAISGVQVNLLSDPAGRSNFDLPASPQTAPPNRAAAATGGTPLLTLDRIGAVTAKDLAIVFANVDSRRGQVTPYLTFSGLNAKIRSFNPSAADWARKLEIAFDLRGARLTSSSLAKPVRFQTGELLIKGGAGRGALAASLDTTHITGTTAIASFAPLSIAFTLTIPELDVDRFERVLGGGGGTGSNAHAPPARPRLVARVDVAIDRLIAAPLEATRARGRLSFYTNTMQLDSYALSAYGGTVQGAAELNYSIASLPASATATVRGLNLERVVSALSPRAPRISGALDGDIKLTTALARDPKAALLARGSVKIDRLVLSPLEATRLSGQLSADPRTIRLDSYALTAYGGTVRGAAALNYTLASLPAAMTARVQGVNLAQMLSALSPKARKVTGALEADLKLGTALGKDPQTALTGAGTFAVRDGSFPGLDLKNNLAQMARALQVNVPAGDTRFRYFGGDLRIAQQRVYSNALRLDGDGLDATARGSFGFNQTLDYTGIGVLKALTPGTSGGTGGLPSMGMILGQVVPGVAGTTGARVPFSLRGTSDDPKFSLAGVPQLLRDQSPQQQPQQPEQPQQPSLPDLFKLLQKP